MTEHYEGTKIIEGASEDNLTKKSDTESPEQTSGIKRDLEESIDERSPLKKNRNPSTISVSSEDLQASAKKEETFNPSGLTSFTSSSSLNAMSVPATGKNSNENKRRLSSIDGSNDDLAGMTQSERKRYREKKRRSDITNAVDELTKVLMKIDPNSFSPNFSFGDGRSKHSVPSSAQNLNRTEIISHAAKVLNRLNSEKDEMKLQIAKLSTMLRESRGGTTTSHNNLMLPQQLHRIPSFTTTTPNALVDPAAQIQQQHLQHQVRYMSAAYPRQHATTTSPTTATIDQLYLSQQLLEQRQRGPY